MKAGYIPTISLVGGKVYPVCFMFCTRTLFFSPTRPCASANIDTLRCPKIEVLKIGSGVRLVRLVQSFFTFLITCVNQESLLLLKEKKNRKGTIATQQFGDASVWIKAYISFVYSLAAYCSSLIDLNCPIFYYILFSDLILGDLLMTHKCFLHVFILITDISKKAIQKQIESARMKEMKWK